MPDGAQVDSSSGGALEALGSSGGGPGLKGLDVVPSQVTGARPGDPAMVSGEPGACDALPAPGACGDGEEGVCWKDWGAAGADAAPPGISGRARRRWTVARGASSGACAAGAERDWAGEAEAAGAEVGAGADWGPVGAGDAGNPEPAPEEGAEAGADWAGTVPPPGTATGPQPSSGSVPPAAGAETGAGADPPPGMATGPQPSSGSVGFTGAGDAGGAMGAAVGAGDVEAAGDAGETAWNSVGAAGLGPAGAGCGSGEVAASWATAAGAGAAECPAEPLGSSTLRAPLT